MPLQQYTRKLAGHGLPISAVVTKMEFDLDSTSPKLVFSAERPLSEAEYHTAVRQGQSEEAQQAISTAINISTATASAAAQPVQIAPPEVAPAEQAKPAAEPTVRQSAKPAESSPKQDVQQMLADWGVDD